MIWKQAKIVELLTTMQSFEHDNGSMIMDELLTAIENFLAKYSHENVDDMLDEWVSPIRESMEKLKAEKHIITIEVEGGCVVDVRNLPDCIDYQLDDHDVHEDDDEDDEGTE